MRRPTLDESNQIFTAAMIGFGGIIGSAISFLLSGAILMAFVRLYQGRISLPHDRKVLVIGAAFAGFFMANALSALLNLEGADILLAVAPGIPFLGFIFVYGRLSLSRRRDILRATELGVVAGSLGTFAFAAIQIAFFEPRAEGLTGNAGVLALICAVLYGLSIQTVLRNEGRMRTIAILAVCAAAGALMLTGMRSLWPMLLVGPVAPLVVFRARLRGFNLWRVAPVAVGIVIILTLVGSTLIQTRVQAFVDGFEAVTEEGDFDNSLGLRLRMWSVGIQLAADKPVFGYGTSDVEFSVSDEPGAAVRGFSHYHNFVLTALVQSGVVGLLATLLMLTTPIWIAAREARDDLADAGFAMMLTVSIAYVTSGLFNIMLGHDILDALFIYAIIVSSFLVMRRSEEGLNAPPRNLAHIPHQQMH